MVHDESDSPLPLPPGSSSVRRTPGESRNSKPAVRSEQDQMATTEAVLGRRTCQPGTTSTTVGRVLSWPGAWSGGASATDRDAARQKRPSSEETGFVVLKPVVALFANFGARAAARDVAAADKVESRSSNARRIPGMTERHVCDASTETRSCFSLTNRTQAWDSQTRADAPPVEP